MKKTYRITFIRNGTKWVSICHTAFIKNLVATLQSHNITVQSVEDIKTGKIVGKV